jgi:hypothetical protein
VATGNSHCELLGEACNNGVQASFACRGLSTPTEGRHRSQEEYANKKIALIFRGDNVREHGHQGRKYTDALQNWNNWKKTLVDDLYEKGYSSDIIFITYDSNIVDKIKEIIQPKCIEIHEKTAKQRNNFQQVLQFIKNNREKYDRFVIMRCDIQYRIPITTWPKWNEYGIFIVNKDVHWSTQKIYADVLFIVDNKSIDILVQAETEIDTIDPESPDMHCIGKVLYLQNIPFHLMYDEYYHMYEHPLHVLIGIENEPDLDNPSQGTILTDISQWN